MKKGVREWSKLVGLRESGVREVERERVGEKEWSERGWGEKVK